MKKYEFKEYLLNICNYLDISEEDLFKNSKVQSIVEARRILFLLCRDRGIKPSQIKEYVKQTQGIDIAHSSVSRGIRSIEKVIENDKDYTFIISKLRTIDDI